MYVAIEENDSEVRDTQNNKTKRAKRIEGKITKLRNDITDKTIAYNRPEITIIDKKLPNRCFSSQFRQSPKCVH